MAGNQGKNKQVKKENQDSKKKQAKSKKTKKVQAHNKALGKHGEDAAVEFLERLGLEVLARNYTCSAGEADIVALDEDAIRFIEVKTRKSTAMGFPEESVGKQKRRRYERIAEMFLREYNGFEKAVTFDIISILATSPDHAFLRWNRNVLACDCRE